MIINFCLDRNETKKKESTHSAIYSPGDITHEYKIVIDYFIQARLYTLGDRHSLFSRDIKKDGLSRNRKK